MEALIKEFKSTLDSLQDESATWTEEEFCRSRGEGKWTKKEIVGHLVDSAVANLGRFTYVQFSDEPMKVITYPQEALVRSNNYQNKDLGELTKLLISLNKQILFVIDSRLRDLDSRKVNINGEINDLAFLCDDYLVHLHHHLAQLR